MSRLFATLAVFGMILLAIGLTIWHALDGGQNWRFSSLAILLAAAAGTIALSIVLMRRYWMPHVRKERSEFLQPIRRLLSAVWS